MPSAVTYNMKSICFENILRAKVGITNYEELQNKYSIGQKKEKDVTFAPPTCTW